MQLNYDLMLKNPKIQVQISIQKSSELHLKS